MLPNSYTSPIVGAFIYTQHIQYCTKLKKLVNNQFEQNASTKTG